MSVAPLRRDDFERLAREGHPPHSLSEVEEAKAMLQPIARYFWRQLLLTMILLVCLGSPMLLRDWHPMAAILLVSLPAGFAISVLMRAAWTQRLLAPAGFTANDVSRAAFHDLT